MQLKNLDEKAKMQMAESELIDSSLKQVEEKTKLGKDKAAEYKQIKANIAKEAVDHAMQVAMAQK